MRAVVLTGAGRAFTAGMDVHVLRDLDVPSAKTLIGALCAATMAGLMWRENRKRERGERDDRLDLPEEDVKNMGDWHPSYRFTL